MKPSTHKAISHGRYSSANTSDVQTVVMPNNTSAIEFAFETNPGRVVFDGSDPSAVNAPALIYPKDQVPVFRPVGPGGSIKYVSTAASPSVLQIAFYQ